MPHGNILAKNELLFRTDLTNKKTRNYGLGGWMTAMGEENIQRIVDSLQEMQGIMKEIAGQIQSGDFSLSAEGYQELKEDYPSLAVTVIDNGKLESRAGIRAVPSCPGA